MRLLERLPLLAGLSSLLGAVSAQAQAPLVIEYDDAADYEVASGRFTVDVNVIPSVARRSAVEVFVGNGQDGPFSTTLANQSVNDSAALVTDATAGSTVIQVGAGNSFAANDLILIVQIQGYVATSGSQTPILSPANVGRFELARVQSVNGANLTLTAGLARSFTAMGADRTQVVLVPEYTDVTITAGTRLIPDSNWNGTDGGIVAFAANGTVTIVGDIDASAAGFRGGPENPIANADCSVNALDTDGRGGRKGEGIDREAFTLDARRFGRGNYANGGGGGNPHNAGGGGGSNGGAGGFGGFQWNCGGAGQDPNTRGMPGARLASPLSARIFFGGGGGGGQENNNFATAGGRGGGIVFLLANALTGTGRVLSNGASAANTAGNDGAGGGGAGGTIYAFTRSTPTGALLFRAAGGNGGNVVTAAAHGPGGGGGGGRVFISAEQGTATIQVPAGANGTNSTQGGVYGSLPGAVGDDEDGSYVQLAIGVTGVDCFRSMTELPAIFHQGDLRYLVSRNGGIDWEYWNGLGWVTGARRVNAMDAATLSANIAGFAPNGSFNLRVYLLGDAAFSPAIDRASFVACTCGDATVSPGEACDDGNNNPGDGCSATCTVEPGWTCTGDPSVCIDDCGDGLIGAGEQCDDGDVVSGDGCSNVCVIEPGYSCTGQPSVCNLTCGNGTLQAGETCDDGNVVAGDGCSPGCLIEPGFGCAGTPSVCTPLCGNGALNGAELCDDGNVNPNDGCSPTCLIEPGFSCTGAPSVCTANCGNGTLQAGETCDDGNIVDGDGCASFCAVEPGWTCVGVPAVCTEDCGDGLVVGAEDCDDGNTVTELCVYGQTACLVCDGTCQEVPGVTRFCGDGALQAGFGETCDDGDSVGGDGCSATCVVEPGWTCAGTPAVCTETCGDSLVVGAEDCDDGNTVTEVCNYGQASCLVCNAACQEVPGATSFCGDGVIAGANGETCDDGDATGGDGCSAACVVEPGWSCAGAPSNCAPICGDGLRVGAEACDDGDTTSGDGCSATCTLEPGWICVGVPAVCTEDCGDGLVVGAETCDDGNSITEVCNYGQPACTVCNAACQSVPGATAFCGDGVLNGGAAETCDDGNTTNGDGCSQTCATEPGWVCVGLNCNEVCGDGLIVGAEGCDDGDTTSGDGCSAVCALEPGWICNGAPTVCTEDCGDGLVVGAEACDDGNTTTEACNYGQLACTVCSAACQSVPGATSFCGDGALNGGAAETCDDGNTTNGDGCSQTCATEPGWVCVGVNCTAICGDGLRVGAEACDDGDTLSGDGCSATCALEPGWICNGVPSICTEDCGDGLVVGAEGCDDGNDVTEACNYGQLACTVCNATCQSVPGVTSFCGDGVQNGGAAETCDDGNNTNGDGCSQTCATEPGWTCVGVNCNEVCGDGLIVGAEACDDGGTASGDGCDATCSLEPGWICNGAPTVCAEDCGDGLQVGVEGCDDGNNVTEACAYGLAACQVCSATCEPVLGETSLCGDSTLDAADGETCDDGNATSGDGCSATCGTEPGWTCGGPSCTAICGDGLLVGAEACDDGNLTPGDGCSTVCAVEPGWSCAGAPSTCSTGCGDGVVAGAEVCDDGNATTESCVYGQTSCLVCDASCQEVPGATSFCGDAALDAGQGELCDDGNAADGDGCTSTCTIEPGWTCTGPSCAPICGDGLLLGAEACDDTNILDGDGCSSLCTIEPGWSCGGTPSVCQTGCGDGVVAGIETCDDGNLVTEVCDYGLQSCVVCSAACQSVSGAASFCGDSTIDLVNGEACDDANLDPGDGCDPLCQEEEGWTCQGPGCVEICGDGLIVGVELCDAGGELVTDCAYGETTCTVCDATCVLVPGQTSFCGDARTDLANAESCDDGNGLDGDGCDASCAEEPGWTCEEDSCRSVCGDGMIVGFEACDHGGVLTESCAYGETSCQVCNEACMFVPGMTSYCGDGVTDGASGETCDDGNGASGDGCSSLCEVEEEPCQGASCPPPPGCGDGVVDAGEGCDDGNVVSGDGCASNCQTESGFECEGVPSVCHPDDGIDVDPIPEAPIDGLPDGSQVAGGGCSCSAPARTGGAEFPLLSLLALGLLWTRRGRARLGRGESSSPRGPSRPPR